MRRNTTDRRLLRVCGEHIDDGWGTADEELPPFGATVTVEQVKSVIQRSTIR